jgi:hypothetical protein
MPLLRGGGKPENPEKNHRQHALNDDRTLKSLSKFQAISFSPPSTAILPTLRVTATINRK